MLSNLDVVLAMLFGFLGGVTLSYGWLRHKAWWQAGQKEGK